MSKLYHNAKNSSGSNPEALFIDMIVIQCQKPHKRSDILSTLTDQYNPHPTFCLLGSSLSVRTDRQFQWEPPGGAGHQVC